MTATIVPDRDRTGIQSQSDYFSHKSAPYVADRKTGLPAGFPTSVVSSAAWTGADFENRHGKEDFTLALDEFDVREIEQACNKFQELGLPLEHISQNTFILPTLGKNLKAMAAELTDGVGFFIIRGLDPQRYSNQLNVAIFLGISSYIGEKRGRQDELGNMTTKTVHLTDLGSALAPENERQAPYSSVGQPFHSDLGDIIGMYALGEAQTGGECNLVSTATVYNEVAKARPDVIRLLSSSSWVFDSFGLSPSHTIRPLLYPMEDEKVLLSFARRPLVGHKWSPRSPGIPELSASHIEALDTLQTIAEEHALTMKLKRGELLFWNNLALLHSRNGFTDSPGSRRHLLRLWLRNDATEKDWPIPEELQSSWKDAFDHAGRPQQWPIEPIKDRDYVSNQQRSSGHD